MTIKEVQLVKELASNIRIAKEALILEDIKTLDLDNSSRSEIIAQFAIAVAIMKNTEQLKLSNKAL